MNAETNRADAETNKTIVQQYWDALAARDWEGMKALLTDDAEYTDVGAGGRRILQDVTGYVATVVNGTVTRRHGIDTGARPGRLVRT